MPERVVKDWLQERVTVAEAEATHMVQNERLGPDPVPFGFLNCQWRALLAQLSGELGAYGRPCGNRARTRR